MHGWKKIVAVAALVAAPATSDAASRRFALVVGENRPATGSLEPLQYADDDALRFKELFERMGAQVRLLTVLDEDTQRQNPGAAALTAAPTRAALGAAMADLSAAMDRAHAAGDTADFYFFLAGHAEAGPNREGRMHLRDGVITRAELMDLVVNGSRADFNHLMIDACYASTLVFRRGSDDGWRERDHQGVVSSYLDQQDLSAHPNTGVLLASSASREAHEWSRFRAGIFSHSVRSGLTGLADANGDGAIEYSELAAFLAAANQAIRDASVRPEIVVQAPELDRNRPLLSFGREEIAPSLRLPAQFSGRAWLEDGRGVRYADFHAGGDRPLMIALVGGSRYFLHRPGSEARLEARGVVDGASLEWSSPRHSARGAVADSFDQELFQVPFDRGFYVGYVASTGLLPAISHRIAAAEQPQARGLGVWPYVAAGTAVLAGGAAVWTGLSAQSGAEQYGDRLRRDGVPDQSLEAWVEGRQAWSNALAAGAGVLAGGALLLFLLDEPGLAVAPTPQGAAVLTRF